MAAKDCVGGVAAAGTSRMFQLLPGECLQRDLLHAISLLDRSAFVRAGGSEPESVAAAVVSEPGDGVCLFVVVVVDPVELFGDACGSPVAEGGGYVAFLPGRLHALVVEHCGGAREGGDLRIDVDDRVGEPFLLPLSELDVAAVDARQLLGSGTQLADLLSDPVGLAGRAGVGGIEPVGPTLRRMRWPT